MAERSLSKSEEKTSKTEHKENGMGKQHTQKTLHLCGHCLKF